MQKWGNYLVARIKRNRSRILTGRQIAPPLMVRMFGCRDDASDSAILHHGTKPRSVPAPACLTVAVPADE